MKDTHSFWEASKSGKVYQTLSDTLFTPYHTGTNSTICAATSPNYWFQFTSFICYLPWRCFTVYVCFYSSSNSAI